MKKAILNLLFLLPLSITIFGQVSFQKNRFASVSPNQAVLKDAGEFYSEYNFSQSILDQLTAKLTKNDVDFITSSAVESALPEAFNTLNKRNENRDKFYLLKLYQVATFIDDGEQKSVLIAPYSENKEHVKNKLISDSDLILIFSSKAVTVSGVQKTIVEKKKDINQDTDLYIVNIMEDIPMGMSLEHFKKVRPKAVREDEAMEFRIVMIEKIASNGIKDITYYFDDAEGNPFYEAIIEYDNEADRNKAVAKLFGKPNRPSKDDLWIIYKGHQDFSTVVWTFNNKFIIAGQVPGSEWSEDDMFIVPDNLENVDLRINKIDNSEIVSKIVNTQPIQDNISPTCVNYAQEIAAIFNAGIDLSFPLAKVIEAIPNMQIEPEIMDFREEYTLKVGNNGVKQVNFIFDKDGDKPLYEMIFEFDNADSTRRLVEMMFGQPNHPTLEDHWVLAKDEKGIVPMIWLFDNKMITAVNLPGTEFENDANFQMPEGFKPKIHSKTDENNSPENPNNSNDIINSEQISQCITEAVNNFEKVRVEALEGKADEFSSAIIMSGADKTIIRKNAGDIWHLEAYYPAVADFSVAQTFFENQISAIENLEGLEYRLVKKSDTVNNNRRTYVWDVQSLDDTPLSIMVKLQLYPTVEKQFAVKIEIGK